MNQTVVGRIARRRHLDWFLAESSNSVREGLNNKNLEYDFVDDVDIYGIGCAYGAITKYRAKS